MKKLLYIFAGVIVLAGAITAWQLSVKKPVVDVSQDYFSQEQPTENVTLILDYPDTEDQIVTQAYTENQSAFDLLLDSPAEVDYQEYDFGVLVTSIANYEGGMGDRYWIYYINNELANVGASDYILQPGDVITWRFEEEKEGL